MTKGFIGKEVDGVVVYEEPFDDFVIGEGSSWVRVPGADTWNCTPANQPHPDAVFDKVMCQWNLPDGVVLPAETASAMPVATADVFISESASAAPVILSASSTGS